VVWLGLVVHEGVGGGLVGWGGWLVGGEVGFGWRGGGRVGGGGWVPPTLTPQGLRHPNQFSPSTGKAKGNPAATVGHGHQATGWTQPLIKRHQEPGRKKQTRPRGGTSLSKRAGTKEGILKKCFKNPGTDQIGRKNIS